MCKAALARGVSLESSFAHFDTEKTGTVDSRRLTTGLAKLNIGISDAAANMLVQQIATHANANASRSMRRRSGTGYGDFTFEEFLVFVCPETVDDQMLQSTDDKYSTGRRGAPRTRDGEGDAPSGASYDGGVTRFGSRCADVSTCFHVCPCVHCATFSSSRGPTFD